MTQPTEPNPTPVPPKRKWFRLSGKACLILITGFAVVAVALFLVWQGNEISRIEAELDRTDPRWRIEEIWSDYLRSVPPDKENSFLVVQRSLKEIPREFIEWSYQADTMSVHLNRVDGKPTDRVDPGLLADAQVQLATLQPALEIAHQTRNYPRLGASGTKLSFDAIGTLLQHVQDVNKVFSILFLEGAVAALEHDPEKALRAALTCVYVGRSLGDEPLGIVQLIRVAGIHRAIRLIELTLAYNPGSEPLLAELQEKLVLEDAIPHTLIHARETRAMVHQMYDRFRRGEDSISAMVARYGLRTPAGGATLQSVLFPFLEKDEHLMVLKRANRWVEIARAPEHEQMKLAKEMPPMPEKYSMVFKLLMGLFDRDVAVPVDGALYRAARIRSSIVGIACERHRLKTGSWPKSLDELPKELLPAIPKDPFTGELLKYKQHDGVLTIYSVGPDGVDDGGQLRRVFHPKTTANFDVGFELYNLDKRTK